MGEEVHSTDAHGRVSVNEGEGGHARWPPVRNLWWKRPLDVITASAVLLVSSPLLATLALAVLIDSPGPALFRQERVGLGGKKFQIWKLRTMHVDNNEQAHRQAAVNWFAG